jgi:catechol 2,3-dioxygenase-like lactoylglutathione lyase family enzyme
MQKRTLIAVLALVLTIAIRSQAQSDDLAGIAHVAFRVADLEKSRQFYETLGFEKPFEFSEGGKVSELFIKINDRQFIELYPKTQDSQALGFMHVCFEVTDIESLRNAYIKHGLTPPESKKFRAGNLLFVLHDPEGQLVEYTQYLPDSMHTADRGQHLGEKRISIHLQAAATPAKDPALQRSFYIEKLGFKAASPGSDALRLPGNSGDELDLQPPSSKSQIAFFVDDVKRTADVLRQRGLSPQVERDATTLTDPDGNLVILRSTQASPKP